MGVLESLSTDGLLIFHPNHDSLLPLAPDDEAKIGDPGKKVNVACSLATMRRV